MRSVVELVITGSYVGVEALSDPISDPPKKKKPLNRLKERFRGLCCGDAGSRTRVRVAAQVEPLPA